MRMAKDFSPMKRKAVSLYGKESSDDEFSNGCDEGETIAFKIWYFCTACAFKSEVDAKRMRLGLGNECICRFERLKPFGRKRDLLWRDYGDLICVLR